MTSLTENIRQAVAILKANPDAVAAVDAEEQARQAAAEKEAKRRADLEAKVAKALPARTEALVADYDALDAEADPRRRGETRAPAARAGARPRAPGERRRYAGPSARFVGREHAGKPRQHDRPAVG